MRNVLDPPSHGTTWGIRFRILGLAAASMLWIKHAPDLRALAASGKGYYGEARRELSCIVRRLRGQSLNQEAASVCPLRSGTSVPTMIGRGPVA
jgi:hypothetical protein